ncbi:MAG: alkaline phosphatase family protein [Pyrinomonadaceae bacterium]|nr:alkaline phosphatase family protein [Pyrinomonadaceae bacterium]
MIYTEHQQPRRTTTDRARHPHRKTGIRALIMVFVLCALGGVSHGASARRVVVLKVDGLPHDMVDRFVRERDPRTRKSMLPWIEHVFYQRGSRVANFYVRGMSLSGPSWSLLDTGQHLQIKGNVEFDRLTLHSYDYLNFFPFYIQYALSKRVDMPGAEVLDELALPLLIDAYPYSERHASFQLYQRGVRWTTLQRGLQNRVTSRTPREVFDEWTTGFDTRSILTEQVERELIEKLNDPRIRYLDLYNTDFDHAAHHNRDGATHLAALRELDATVGRVWTAIQKTPQADQTALILVSDHGTNTDERVYSQGYNLVKLLGSTAGGGHHVITKRRLLNDYALKGIYPLVPLITTTTSDSYYLKKQSTSYPTALIDFDGNERSSIHLRDSDLNVLHILFQQLQRRDLAPELRRAATASFFSMIEARRPEWQTRLSEMTEELGALRRMIEEQRALVASQPKTWTAADRDAGRDQDARRTFARLDSWAADEREYTEHLRALANLLALRRESFDPQKIIIEDLIAKGAMGDSNSIHRLQNYVVGLALAGLVLAADGSLDADRSFARVNYFHLLGDAAVRNNVQPGVSHRPIDFVATRIPRDGVREALLAIDPRDAEAARDTDEVVWLYGGRDAQALLLSCRGPSGELMLRYVPVAGLQQDAAGRVSFERVEWRAGLPLKIFEDPNLTPPKGATRIDWLSGWHTDLEWLRAVHQTEYSNAVVGLHEQLARHPTAAIDPDAPGLSNDERLLRRFRRRQRLLVEADLLILANNHWNFDVRGFNPGGNHGSFFRVSTHSTLMLAGGAHTGIPRALVIDEPYDSLSFMPTVMALTGQLNDGRQLIPVLRRQDAAPHFPGRLIREIFTSRPDADAPATAADNDGIVR